jgi:hypothetical protein
MDNLFAYYKSIIENIHHVEDILVKFALQNYAVAGAVFVAFFANILPLRVAAPAVVGVNVAPNDAR